MAKPLAPVLFVSHGGGPLPLLGEPRHQEMVNAFEEIRKQFSSVVEKPKAIVMISAHWEAPQFSVGATEAPDMIYDYYGFPPESFKLQYPAPGAPELAERLVKQLKNHMIMPAIDHTRGFDHGVFVPLMMLFPEAEIPVIPISLHKHFDPMSHIELGRAIADLRADGVMVIGSGMSFHNLPLLFESENPMTQTASTEFTAWLDSVVDNPNISEVQRAHSLADWAQAPHARLAHPREEHLLPLHVCYGAAETSVTQTYAFNIMGVPSRCYWWS